MPGDTCSILMSCSSKTDVITFIQNIFQQFPVSGLFLCNPWVPIVLGHGLSSGLVLNVADTVIILGSIDIVLGEVDR